MIIGITRLLNKLNKNLSGDDKIIVEQIIKKMALFPNPERDFDDSVLLNLTDRLKIITNDPTITPLMGIALCNELEQWYRVDDIYQTARLEFLARAVVALSVELEQGKQQFYDTERLAKMVKFHAEAVGLTIDPIGVRKVLYGDYLSMDEYALKYGVTTRHIKTIAHFQRVLRVILYEGSYLVEDRPMTDDEKTAIDEQTYLTRQEVMDYLNGDYWIMRALDIQPDNVERTATLYDAYFPNRSSGNIYHFPKINSLKLDLHSRPNLSVKNHTVLTLSVNNEPNVWCLKCGCRWPKSPTKICPI